MVSDVDRMKPKELRQAIGARTEAIVAMQLGLAPANDNRFAIRQARASCR